MLLPPHKLFAPQLLPCPPDHVIFIGFLLVWRHSLSRREHIRAEKQGPVSTARSSAQRFRPRQHVQTVPVVYKQAAVGANLRIRNFNPGRSASVGSLTGPKLIGCVVGSGSYLQGCALGSGMLRVKLE